MSRSFYGDRSLICGCCSFLSHETASEICLQCKDVMRLYRDLKIHSKVAAISKILDYSKTNLFAILCTAVIYSDPLIPTLYNQDKTIDAKKIAFPWFQQKQNFDSLGYCYVFIGLIYLNIENNFQLGLFYLEKSAQLGLDIAQFSLGTALFARKPVESFKWLKRSADEHNNPLSQLIVAGFNRRSQYEYLIDTEEAFRYTNMSADQGNITALSLVGNCFANGYGTEINQAEAFRYLKLAAERGCKMSQYQIGLRYMKGFGVEKDKQEGLRLVLLAADSGLVRALVEMATYYEHEERAPDSLQKAIIYYSRACQANSHSAKQALKRIKSNLFP